jgi:hypothetical protein
MANQSRGRCWETDLPNGRRAFLVRLRNRGIIGAPRVITFEGLSPEVTAAYGHRTTVPSSGGRMSSFDEINGEQGASRGPKKSCY